MATRNIVKIGDEVLRKKARQITVFDEKLAQLAQDMIETMHKGDGVGLAGPQVGLLRRIVVIEPPEQEPLTLVNPEIISSDGEEDGVEGCLSVPGKYGYVLRPTTVRCRAHDVTGKQFTFTADGFAARIVCHELDHLEGILFTDKVSRYYEENSDDTAESSRKSRSKTRR